MTSACDHLRYSVTTAATGFLAIVSPNSPQRHKEMHFPLLVTLCVLCVFVVILLKPLRIDRFLSGVGLADEHGGGTVDDLDRFQAALGAEDAEGSRPGVGRRPILGHNGSAH